MINDPVTMPAEPVRTAEALYLAQECTRPLRPNESRGSWRHPAPRRPSPLSRWGKSFVEGLIFGLIVTTAAGLIAWAVLAVAYAIQSPGDM